MEQALKALLQLLQQGIAAIFRFLDLLWTWSIGQIDQLVAKLGSVSTLPVWKIAILVVAAIVVIGLLLRAGKELWDSGERLLSAFVTLLGAIIHVLPWIILAGIAAALAVGIVNNVNL